MSFHQEELPREKNNTFASSSTSEKIDERSRYASGIVSSSLDKPEMEAVVSSYGHMLDHGAHQTRVKQSSQDHRQADEASEQHQRQHLHQHQQQHHSHHHHHHNIHRHHAPTCTLSKLVSSNLSPELRHHQGHCARHKPVCAHQLPLNRSSQPEEANPIEKSKPIKCLKQNDKSYLLVQYRPHLQSSSNAQSSQNHSSYNLASRVDLSHSNYLSNSDYTSSNNQSSNKRTTIRFISQLYFLLHLSAILSLLLHHKNLVASRNEATSSRHNTGDPTRATDTKRPFVFTKETSPIEASSEPIPVSLTDTTTSDTGPPNPLPEPQMIVANERYATSGRLDDLRLRPRQLGDGGGARITTNNNTDILVRLVGYWHARCAILYFLCYLLSSSVTMLIGMRLLRFCGWQTSQPIVAQVQAEARTNNCNGTSFGFYYRTRLDCTPVLIGSISLGLIQLIVIGLEIANKVHWLSDGRWPIYLPFLQFAFVSLLMQYILGQVAKNHKHQREQKLQGFDLDGAKPISRPALSKNNSSSRQRRIGQISNGIENIALAHLLVTHILLWLMKLNSISLFQPIEQPNLLGAPNPLQHLTSNSLYPSNSQLDTPAISTVALNSDKPSQFASESVLSTVARRNAVYNQVQSNHSELENLLRKRLQLSRRPQVPSGEDLPQVGAKLPTLGMNNNNTKQNQSGLPYPRKQPEPPSVRGDMPIQLEQPNNSTIDRASSISTRPATDTSSQARGETLRQEVDSTEQVAGPFNQSKPTLPKRMTAFRQAKPQLVKNSTSVISTTSAPKQRARVLISHTDEITDLTESSRPRVPQEIHIVEPITTERPFPSVEPPSEAPSMRFPTTTQPTVSFKPTLSNPTQIGDEVSNTNDHNMAFVDDVTSDSGEDNTPAGGTSTTEEEAEQDLESMLPPVPNFNESEVLPQPESNEQEVPFNDPAASTLDVSRNSSSRYSGWGSRVPTAQPLVRRQRSHEEELASKQDEPSFSDYLLPIVHQYHILIIAILLHMWLDSLKHNKNYKDFSIHESNMSRQQRTAWLVNTGANSGNRTRSDGSVSSGRLVAIPVRRAGKSHARWRPSKHQRSHSMDSLHHREARNAAGFEAEESSSSNEASGSSRSGSLRSSSSEQLLWVSSAQIRTSGAPKRSDSLSDSSSRAQARHRLLGRGLEASRLVYGQPRLAESPRNSVCSVFLGILIVSGSLIVIVLGIELLSALTQCLAQLMSIMACMLGLCLLRGSRTSNRAKQQRQQQQQVTSSVDEQAGHRQCFHYLFLLAAYFCGLSLALNLNKQASAQQLFSQQVLQFIQRHISNPLLSSTTTGAPSLSDQLNQQQGVVGSAPTPITNYLLCFHGLLALKGLLLVVQVTLQTILIRASCAPATRQLRQVYTFLMFANLSLWALEICEQQQQLQRVEQTNLWLHQHQRQQVDEQPEKVRLLTLDSFSKFAASIVTLSHLYHGLVFMQH